MKTLRAFYDGRVIIPRESVDLPAGQNLVLTIESAEQASAPAEVDLFAPLPFTVAPETSRRIMDDPDFNIENS